MTVDLKWFLPAVMPFVFVGLVRLLALVVGVPWNMENGTGAVLVAASFVVGGGIGTIAALAMEEADIRWNVKIGKSKDKP